MDNKYTDYAIYAIGALILIIFLQTCGMKSTLRDTEDYMIERMDSIAKIQNEKLMSIDGVVISEEKMKELIKTTPAWKTLRLEEISDKEHISINALEEQTEIK
jgi:hypothetical protein